MQENVQSSSSVTQPNIKILTIENDAERLRSKSVPFPIDKTHQEVVNDLILELGNTLFRSSTAVGLAAPQIGISQRAFIAKLFTGVYVFVNPELTLSGHLSPSTEGCLSCPGVSRTVERNFNVKINAELIVKIGREKIIQTEGPFDLCGLDAFIVQHENDHLDGVLLVDKPEVAPYINPKVKERITERQAKIKKARNEKKTKQVLAPTKMSKKKLAQLKKDWKLSDRREKLRVEIQEMMGHKQEQQEHSKILGQKRNRS